MTNDVQRFIEDYQDIFQKVFGKKGDGVKFLSCLIEDIQVQN